MIYVLDRDDQWWRAKAWAFTNGIVRLDYPEHIQYTYEGLTRPMTMAWKRYSEFGVEVEDVTIPMTFVKRYVIT